MRKFSFLLTLSVLIGFLAISAVAQNASARFKVSVDVLDSTTLKSENYNIVLWGVEPFDGYEPVARTELDAVVGQGAEINCRPFARSQTYVKAACLGSEHIGDLGLYMIQNGYALANRNEILGTEYAQDYLRAEQSARQNALGGWRGLGSTKKPGVLEYPEWMNGHGPALVAYGPLVVLGMILVIVLIGFNRLLSAQNAELNFVKEHETALQKRERSVLLTALEREMVENKNKVEAFITIYKQMLEDLNDSSKPPKYQRGGELIHKFPALTRTVFDENSDKLYVLDLKLSNELSRFYMNIKPESEYSNLEPSTPLIDAIKEVEQVIKNAQNMLPAIEGFISKFDQK